MKKYIEDDGLDQQELSKTVMDEFLDEPAYQRCRATLNSSAKLDSLVLIFSLPLSFNPGDRHVKKKCRHPTTPATVNGLYN